MPFKDFAVGEVLSSADVDLYLMSQVIIRCTSGTRPSSPAQGWHIYETDTGRDMVYDGTAWVEPAMTAVQPSAKVRRAANLSTSTSTDTAVSFDTETYDVGNMWSAGSPTRLTVPAGKGGVYLLGGHGWFSSNSTGMRQVQVRLNGSTTLAINISVANSAGNHIVGVAGAHPLVAGDYLELVVFQTSGGSLNVIDRTDMWACRVGL